jgi:ABC-type bacteriocin/lantibiotic exporter with double-glycine peptidase domain
MFYSVEIGIMTVLFVPFFILVSNKYSERLSKNGEDTINSMQEVREYNADFAKYSVVERFKNISRFVQIGPLLSKYKTNKNRQIKNEAFFCNFLSYALLNLLINAALIISAIMVCSGKMTVGALFAVQLYISNYWDPIECLISIYKEFYSVKKVIVNFEELLTLECVEYEESEIPEIGIIDYVSLDKDNKELHEPVSISFTPGKLYVITGENGVGKTTLINSIMGFSDRYHGEIEVNNKGHNKNFVYSIAEPPESKFFNGLVTDKYSMGQKKIKQIQSDVMEEKDVYLFDEPTNYLDKQKKRTVIESLRRKVDQNKIVIAISHDKDIIDEADRVINLA